VVAYQEEPKYKVQHHRLNYLLATLKLGDVDGSYLKVLGHPKNVDLILLDGLKLEVFGCKQITDLHCFVEDQYQRRSTLIISHPPVSQRYS